MSYLTLKTKAKDGIIVVENNEANTTLLKSLRKTDSRFKSQQIKPAAEAGANHIGQINFSDGRTEKISVSAS